jgi:hypothetical protein
VLYTPGKSPTEHLESFYTEEDALEWIKFESASWLAKKKRCDTRPCRQLSQKRTQTRATAARKVLASLS